MVLSVTLVTFISFVFIGASSLMQVQISKAESTWYDKVEVVAWLCPDGMSQAVTCSSGKAPDAAQRNQLVDDVVNNLPTVISKVTPVSPQDFFKNVFTKEYPGGVFQGRTLTAADMQWTLRIKLKDPTKYKEVAEVLNGKEGVEEVVDQQQIFEPVFSLLNSATVVTVILAVVMVLVAVLLTGTTIRMSTASRRNEIEIMRLVGASNWTIRLPFILEGAIAALIGSVLSAVVLGGVVRTFVTGWLAKSVTFMPLVDMGTVFWLAPILVVGAIVLSVIASAVSLRRYLKI
jgi:cell division transport system permease protein